MIQTHLLFTVQDILQFWKPEWDTSSTIEKVEFLPSLSEESENVTKGPWGMSYQVAKETLEYIDRIKTRVYIACFSSGVCTDFIRLESRGEPKEYVSFINKRLDKSLYWTENRKN